MTIETHGFQTEARKLLRLVINSLYSNKEVFLRELISNASDAIDRLRFAQLSDPSLVEEGEEFEIAMSFDKETGTLTVSDNGIGMTQEEVVSNLGTIAKSGTEEFLEKLTGDQKTDALLIGQFGVGFYSVFMVADSVEVETKKAGEEQGTIWRSTGEEEFSVEPCDCARGTKVHLRLKEDATEFADEWRLREIVRRYSDHISVPVRLPKSDESGELETVNQAVALWTRPRSEISDEEYNGMYKHLSHDFEDPLAWSHNKVEGSLEYTSLLYIPKKAPFDLWHRDRPRGLKLYVQRVFIMDDAETFLPMYLRWVKGIVDSSDLPLNVSRETLQENEQVASIRTGLTKRVLSILKRLSEDDAQKYCEFWDQFGQVVKEGVGNDPANQADILELLRFRSVCGSETLDRTSLKEYVERGGTEQDKIYYLVGSSPESVADSPHLEVFHKKSIEVLLLSDPVDPWMVPFVTQYENKEFLDISRGELNLGSDKTSPEDGSDSDQELEQPKEEEQSDLLNRLKEALGDRVEDVRESTRLTESAACLVLDKNDTDHQLRRLLATSGQEVPLPKPHLEVNLDHALLKHLAQQGESERFSDVSHIIFDQAALSDGQDYLEAGPYVKRLNRLLSELLA